VVKVDPLEIAAWELVAGELRSEDLPALASDALVRGVDSPTLGELAAQSSSDVRTSADLFREVITELGIELPDLDEALWNLVRSTVRGVVDGDVPPGIGARKIWRWAWDVEDSGDLRIFIGLASELDDYPEDRAVLEAQIMAEAGELLRRGQPRVWIKLMAVNADSALSRSVGSGSAKVDPLDLPVSVRLRSDLAGWNAEHAALLSNWPGSGGFSSTRAAEQFVEAGQSLVRRLQDELGPDYHVEYMPEPIRPPGVRLAQEPAID